MKLFENLNSSEKELLLKFPAYISLLAANTDGKLDEAEQKEAIQLTEIKRHSPNPVLKEYYIEVEKNFEQNILKINADLPTEKAAREETIKKELKKLEEILARIDEENATQLRKSIKSYTDHVSKAHNNPLEFFLVPFFISGLTD